MSSQYPSSCLSWSKSTSERPRSAFFFLFVDGQSSSQEGIRSPVAVPELPEQGHFPLSHLPSCIWAPREELGPFPCWMCPSFQGSVFIPNLCVKWRNPWIFQSSIPAVFSLSDISHTCFRCSFLPAQAVSSLSHEIMFYWEKYHLRNALGVPELPVPPRILSFLSSGWFCRDDIASPGCHSRELHGGDE